MIYLFYLVLFNFFYTTFSNNLSFYKISKLQNLTKLVNNSINYKENTDKILNESLKLSYKILNPLNKEKIYLNKKDELSNNVSKILEGLLLNYDKNERPFSKDNLTIVQTNLHIRSMGPISEQAMEYSLDCYFRQKWQDFRLKYEGNFETLTLNIHMLERIWKPDTFFLNGKDSYIHEITRPNKFLRIHQGGEVYYSMRLTIKARCLSLMELRNYPMDKQSCPLYFGSYGYEEKDLKFFWDPKEPVSLANDLVMSQFDLISYPCRNFTRSYRNRQYSMVQVNFNFIRHTGYFLIQIYFPCALIVVLSWVSFWINRENTADRVGLGVTLKLTLATFGLETRTDFPKVSYPTALDWFVIMCFLFVNATLIQFSFVHYFTKVGSGEVPFYYKQLKNTPKKSLKKSFLKQNDDSDESFDELNFIDNNYNLNEIKNNCFKNDYKTRIENEKQLSRQMLNIKQILSKIDQKNLFFDKFWNNIKKNKTKPKDNKILYIKNFNQNSLNQNSLNQNTLNQNSFNQTILNRNNFNENEYNDNEFNENEFNENEFSKNEFKQNKFEQNFNKQNSINSYKQMYCPKHNRWFYSNDEIEESTINSMTFQNESNEISTFNQLNELSYLKNDNENNNLSKAALRRKIYKETFKTSKRPSNFKNNFYINNSNNSKILNTSNDHKVYWFENIKLPKFVLQCITCVMASEDYKEHILQDINEDDHVNSVSKIDTLSKYLFPISFIFANTLYWLYYYTERSAAFDPGWKKFEVIHMV